MECWCLSYLRCIIRYITTYLCIFTSSSTVVNDHNDKSSNIHITEEENKCIFPLCQPSGLLLLSVLTSIVCVLLGVVAWLHHRPQDKEYLTTEMLIALIIVLLEQCCFVYDTYCQQHLQYLQQQLSSLQRNPRQLESTEQQQSSVEQQQQSSVMQPQSSVELQCSEDVHNYNITEVEGL